MKETLRCFKNNEDDMNITVVGTDMEKMEDNFTGIDVFYKVGRCKEKGYVDDILSICLLEKVDVLIPFNTLELELFAERKNEFEEKGIKVMVASGELSTANDKIKMKDFLATTDIRRPIEFSSEYFHEALNKIHLYDKTLCVKQRQGCGGRGFRIIGSEDYDTQDKPSGSYISIEDLEQLFLPFGGQEVLFQEYLPGKEYTVDMLVNKGEFVCGAVKENSCMENGVARRSTIVECPEAMEQCKEICRLLELDGCIGFDLKCGEDGYPYVIDINPRLTATVSLLKAGGLNLPWLALKKVLGMDYQYNNMYAELGTTIVRRLADFYYDSEGNRI